MFDLMPFDRRERKLMNYFDNLEKSFFDDMDSFMKIRSDVLDKGDHYEINAELPGFDKNDIKIDVDGDRLMITAEHNCENEEKKEHFIRRERHYGSFARSFDISNVKADEISAEYDKGVLKLRLPKRTEKTPESRRIDIR